MNYTSWDKVPTEVLSDCISRKIITGEKAMVAQVFISKGGVVAARGAYEILRS